MSFSAKKIGKISTYDSRKDLFYRKMLIKTFVIASSIAIIIFLGKYLVSYAQEGFSDIGEKTIKMIGKNLGDPIEKDIMGHINILIVGYAGEDKLGGLLTDTIMVASFNPILGAVTFLSIPRDLFVLYNKGRKDKINGVYRAEYIESKGSREKSIKALTVKVEEITGLEINSYMMVDFDGFMNFIDEIGGIEVDVKETIHDTSYPGPNNSYQTFHIDSGKQILDGKKALKYARSRKSTSDFSRTLRQQQVIEGIISQIISEVGFTNIKGVYAKFQDIVFTNITLKQILRLGSFSDTLSHFFSYVYTADCDLRYLERTKAGCILTYGKADQFAGTSALVPVGASYGNLSYYKKTVDFAFWVVYNQSMLMEKAPVSVFNGIDKKTAKEKGYKVTGIAGILALDLKKRGLNIVDIDNTDKPFDNTTIYIPGNGRYPETVDTLKAFVDIKEVKVDEDGIYGMSGVTLILGNDYLKRM